MKRKMKGDVPLKLAGETKHEKEKNGEWDGREEKREFYKGRDPESAGVIV